MKISPVFAFTYKHSVNKVMHPNQHVFEFYSNIDKNKLGTLVCHKSELKIRPDYDGMVLAIDFIETRNKNQGWGTRILEFAKKYSKQIGCNGFMTLKADGSYTPKRIPHIFYRKFGFSTLESNTDKELDRFIKKGENATIKDFPCLLMHFPAQDKKPTFLERILLQLLNRIK